MGIGWRDALAGAAVLFLAFLVLKLRPSGRDRARLDERVRAARLRARSAKTDRERAEAFCEAGRYARDAARWRLAAGYFLRAMNADPAWAEGVRATTAALVRRRPRLLERILWLRLTRVPWDAPHEEALRAVVRGLCQLYERRVRDRPKAEFMRRFEARLASGPEGVG